MRFNTNKRAIPFAILLRELKCRTTPRWRFNEVRGGAARRGLGLTLTPWRLAQHWPGSEFVIVSEAGHDARDPGMNDAVVAATDRFAPVNRQHSAGSALPLLLLPLSGDVRFDRTRPVHSENTPAYATLWSR